MEQITPLRIFSTFTGIGGFEIGIRNAYRSTHRGSESNQTPSADYRERLLAQAREDISTAKGQLGAGLNGIGADEGPHLVGYSEIDKYAIKVFQRHFPGVKNYGDITKINAEELPDFDIIVGGFPCQSFSIAGKRRGFEDTRGTLFFDLARIIRAKKPRLFVFENVKGLLNHDKGRTFTTILATIDELGYDCQWQVLNSKNHGVPQNRERIYIVGHLRGTTRPEVFPLTGSYGNDIKEITRGVPQAQRVYDEAGIAPSADTGQGGNRQAKIVVRIPEATQKGYAEATPGQAINLNSPNSKTRRGRVSDISPTIDTTPDVYTLDDIKERKEDALGRNMPKHRTRWSGLLHNGKRWGLRRLTPLECERLQGFPDNWTEFGKDAYEVPEGEKFSFVLHTGQLEPMSDTQRYKMCGNAVTTKAVQAVFERILA